jgi:hypothetical protein
METVLIRLRIISALTLCLCAVASPLQARDGATLLEERFKTAINDMVREAESAGDPASRRERLRGFIVRLDDGLGKALEGGALSEADRASLGALQARFQAYRAELDGRDGFAPVEDADLGRFATYVQQDLEQAPVGGGIYISAGALIVILLLLIVLF